MTIRNLTPKIGSLFRVDPYAAVIIKHENGRVYAREAWELMYELTNPNQYDSDPLIIQAQGFTYYDEDIHDLVTVTSNTNHEVAYIVFKNLMGETLYVHPWDCIEMVVDT